MEDDDLTELEFRYSPCSSPRLSKFDLRVIKGTCGGDLFSTSDTSSIVAGNFSVDGRTSMRCKWLISAPISEQVEFNVTSLVLNPNCDLNYLIISQQPHVSLRHTKFVLECVH